MIGSVTQWHAVTWSNMVAAAMQLPRPQPAPSSIALPLSLTVGPRDRDAARVKPPRHAGLQDLRKIIRHARGSTSCFFGGGQISKSILGGAKGCGRSQMAQEDFLAARRMRGQICADARIFGIRGSAEMRGFHHKTCANRFHHTYLITDHRSP